MLISHNKEPCIVPRARVGHEDKREGRMGQSLPCYQGYLWKITIKMPLLDLDIIEHWKNVTI